MSNFDFSELDRFEEKLTAAGQRVDRVGIQLTDNSAQRMVGESKRVVRRKTGQLAQDIRVIRKGSFGQDLVGAEFGVDSKRRGFVGLLIEHGFIHASSGQQVGPFPYLSTALDRYRGLWIERVKEAAAKLIVK